jgi:DDE superfamily endonuclease
VLVPTGPPTVAVDDTLWRRSGPRLHGAAWHHDGNGPGRHRPAWGHRWVVLGIIVAVPMTNRPVCLPLLARLWVPGDPEHTPQRLARELLDLLAAHLGDRRVHLVGDAAYIGQVMRNLPEQVTVTARLRADAVLHEVPPPRTGRPGRPRTRGARLPDLAHLAGMTRYAWTRVQVRCYGTRADREVLALRCLWYGALKGQMVQVVLSRCLGAPDGYDLAIVSTDLVATPQALIERYADRWPIETMFLQARHLVGVGQARTRTRRSVERVVPFGLACYSLLVIWYAHHGQPTADLAAHRARAPWYRHKQAVSVPDMLAALRRALWVAQFRQGHPDLDHRELFPDGLVTGLYPAA